VRRREPPEPPYEPFALPGISKEDAAVWLIEHGQLTWEEIMILEAAVAGVEDGPLNLTAEQAAMHLARWRGPIRGLRLIELPHWRSRGIVRRGAPLDTAARRDAGRSPFDGAV
jgi:hypothetical protein